MFKSVMLLIGQFLSPLISPKALENLRYVYYVSITRHVTNKNFRPTHTPSTIVPCFSILEIRENIQILKI